MSAIGELGGLRAPVIDLQAVRRQQLEDEQLRVLASAVGEHPLPPEQLSRLERVRALLGGEPFGPAAP